MKLVSTKAELIQQQEGLEGLYKHIELCGRTCYKSTDKITDDSAKPFVDRMINSHHTAMLEHGTVYLKFEMDYEGMERCDKYYHTMPYSECCDNHKFYYVTTNLRVIYENDWLDDLEYICKPTEFHQKRYTFKMLTSIGVTRELNRHRVNSIAEQSTRYCNYSKDKFGGEVAFCIPNWIDIPEGTYKTTAHLTPDIKGTANSLWFNQVSMACDAYLTLIQEGWQPQQAREVLPLCTATEIVHTAFAFDWRHFFDLRLFAKTGNPHPNMLLLTQLMKAEAEKAGIWDDIMRQPSKFE